MCLFGGGGSRPTLAPPPPAPAPTPQPSLVSPENSATNKAVYAGRRSLRIDLGSNATTTGTGANVPT